MAISKVKSRSAAVVDQLTGRVDEVERTYARHETKITQTLRRIDGSTSEFIAQMWRVLAGDTGAHPAPSVVGRTGQEASASTAHV